MFSTANFPPPVDATLLVIPSYYDALGLSNTSYKEVSSRCNQVTTMQSSILIKSVIGA